MELAIPGVALGLLYVASNQNKKNEGFRSYKGLPNANIPDKNYPDTSVKLSDLDETAALTKAAILNQSAMAMVAQANDAQQSILTVIQ